MSSSRATSGQSSAAASSSSQASSSQVPSSSQATSASQVPSGSGVPAASGAEQELPPPSQVPSGQAEGGGGTQMPMSQFPFQQNRGQVNVRRPKAIVFDILGTASKSGFLDKILFPFLRTNMETYINQHWNRKDFKKLYKVIVEQSHELNRQNPSVPVVSPHGASDSKVTLLNFIGYITDNGIASPAVTKLRFMIWFTGYQQSKLITPIYKDVPNRMRTWFAEGVKFYVFSNTWVEAQKALLKNTNHGDLTSLISGHYDNDFGQLGEVDSWRRLCNDIRENANDVLFLTKSPAEARAAMEAGVQIVLVLTHRHNVKAVTPEERQMFPYVRTLDDLNWLEGSMMPHSSEINLSQRPTANQRSALQSAPVGNLTSASNQVPTALSVASGSGSRTPPSRPLVGSQQTGMSGVTSAGSQSASAMAALGSKPSRSKGKKHSRVSGTGSSAHGSSSRRQSGTSTQTTTGVGSKPSTKGGAGSSSNVAGSSSAAGTGNSQSAAGKSKK